MRAINDYIIVDIEKVGPKKVGGLLLTEELDETNRYIKATIISTGNLVEGLKDNDIIVVNSSTLNKVSTGLGALTEPIAPVVTGLSLLKLLQ